MSDLSLITVRRTMAQNIQSDNPTRSSGDVQAVQAAGDGMAARALQSILQSAPSRMTVRMVEFDEIDASLIQEWEALEQRSTEGNASLSPCFVVPAAKNLTPTRKPSLLVVESGRPAAELVGLVLVQRSAGSRLLPMPHLKAYRSIHSLSDGLLVDAELSELVVESLFEYLTENRHRWHGLEFNAIGSASPLQEEMDATTGEFGMRWFADEEWQRPILRTAGQESADVNALLGNKRCKKLMRKLRQLERSGQVSQRTTRIYPDQTSFIDRFLRLESLGWKGAAKTALASDPAQNRFFREMIAGFARSQRAEFVELLVDQQVAATACTLISGCRGSLFKIGWDPQFAKSSPGMLNAFLQLKNTSRDFGDLEYIDSCAAPDSFLGRVWPSQRTMRAGVYTTSSVAAKCCASLTNLRQIKRSFTNPSSKNSDESCA